MDKDLAQIAIDTALSGNWKKAIDANKNILKDEPENIDALNRLARAYAELGDFKNARFTATKVIKTDPYNTIASKSLKKWKDLKKGAAINSGTTLADTFLEEPGRTKIVTLLHPGDTRILSTLDSGDIVLLNTHTHRVSITTKDGKYVGRLSDDLASRLRKLVKGGNKYEVFIKSIEDEEVRVFIKETQRAKKLEAVPSFPTERIDYIAFTPPELVHKKEDRPIIEHEEGS